MKRVDRGTADQRREADQLRARVWCESVTAVAFILFILLFAIFIGLFARELITQSQELLAPASSLYGGFREGVQDGAKSGQR